MTAARWGKQCLKCRCICNKNSCTFSLTVIRHTFSFFCCCRKFMLYRKQHGALSLHIINGYQFNFLSKQPSLITHRKKWLILMKSHGGKCHTFFHEPPLNNQTACETCDFSVLLWFFWRRLSLTAARSQIIFGELKASAPVHPWAPRHGPQATFGFCEEAFGTRAGLLLHARGLRWFVFLWKWTPFK